MKQLNGKISLYISHASERTRAKLKSGDLVSSSIACTSPVDRGFVVLELATSLTYHTTYVEMYHWYIFVRACY
jgi:hypothetical protein